MLASIPWRIFLSEYAQYPWQGSIAREKKNDCTGVTEAALTLVRSPGPRVPGAKLLFPIVTIRHRYSKRSESKIDTTAYRPDDGDECILQARFPGMGRDGCRPGETRLHGYDEKSDPLRKHSLFSVLYMPRICFETTQKSF